MSFLKAEWRKLILANYEVNPSVLLPYLPYKTELDIWQGKTYVSLVGFMFLNTRVLGIKFPFHTNFEEVNLRFYVRYNEAGTWKRGVVFISEIVPRMAIAFIANTLYKENYMALPMSHFWREEKQKRIINYAWRYKGEDQSMEVEADLNSSEIMSGSEEEFITEHYWGYAKHTDKITNEYEVRHPKWVHYPVSKYEIKVDFGKLYGASFNDLAHKEPTSVMLAEGSEVSVEKGKVIRGGN